jgi:FKBP-type peptidyl-prolyl cis-trans isomerase (trigger factor)
MTKTQIERQDDGTIKLTITIPQDEAKKAVEEAIISVAKNANVKGFRRGKAPKKLVEEQINPEHIREEALKKLLPKHYQAAITEHQIRPIMSPKIHIEKLEEGEDWIFEAHTCEAPDVNPGKYKESVQKVTAKSKIIIPGKEQQKPSFADVSKALLEAADVKIPSILLEQEADRLLSQFLEDIKKLGLSLDQYLASTKRTPEDLRAEYVGKAESDMKIEFVLQKIAELEKITVDEKEVEEAIQKAKSPEERQNLENNRYLLAAILRQQKTLDLLMGL